jgi:hypothetical protein
MVSKVVEEAFVEGRETKTPWEKSKAKKKAIALEVAMENYSIESEKNVNGPRRNVPLDMICPDTGKVLASFPSRIAAARHIVTHILKRPSKNPVSVTGNLAICMNAGWKSYGYYWKYNPTGRYTLPEDFDITNGVVISSSGGSSEKVCHSYAEIANLIDVDRGIVRKRILRGAPIDESGTYWINIPYTQGKVRGYKRKKANPTAKWAGKHPKKK